ncbi:hypothetical protein QBC35DRAFT_507486 [Podospora australis]|uniref:Uncharacterized protein n=1 Tax=Podospora australis TaxID=1536484 RepID=A0AAN7AEK4_9PEZI|nr:hypothetical protein QBC35DRAFT_507486 [Podospora australis]
MSFFIQCMEVDKPLQPASSLVPFFISFSFLQTRALRFRACTFPYLKKIFARGPFAIQQRSLCGLPCTLNLRLFLSIIHLRNIKRSLTSAKRTGNSWPLRCEKIRRPGPRLLPSRSHPTRSPKEATASILRENLSLYPRPKNKKRGEFCLCPIGRISEEARAQRLPSPHPCMSRVVGHQQIGNMADEATPPRAQQRPGLTANAIVHTGRNAERGRDYLMRMFLNPCTAGDHRWRREISWILLWGRSRATGYEAVSLRQERLVARSRARARARMRSILRALEPNLPPS